MKKVLMYMTILFTNSLMVSAQQKADSLNQIQLDEVVVSSTRAIKNDPIAFSNLNEKGIKKDNAGKNVPFVLQTLPSVVAYSEDGTGLGNTYFRIRGTDASRINVTLNGMPVNNPESQEVFWVNLPDLSNSLQSIQVQRGVGTSSNGAASFGGSVSLQTTGSQPTAYGSASTAIGSYNSFISSIAAGTGILKNGFSLDGRYSHTSGTGYIRNGKVDHKSAYITAAHFSEKQLFRLVYLNGEQHTGITWEGAEPADLETDRRYNPSGKYKDDAGNIHYYDNDTDNYYSNIVQGIYTRYLSQWLTLNANVSYNNGYGYYENYKAGDELDGENLKKKYGIEPQIIGGVTHKKSDVVRRKLLSNDLYTTILNLTYKKDKYSLSGGGMYSYFDGSHYGQLPWVKYNQNIPQNYEWYSEKATKSDMSAFIKGEYSPIETVNVYAELQNRYIDYRMKGNDDDMVDITQNYYYNFVNPKVGISINLNERNNLYASFGISNREPQRADLKNYMKSKQSIKSERLYDYEAGYRFTTDIFSFESNLYMMDYKDQLVSTGKLSTSGYKLQENAPQSYRMGIELSAAYKPLQWLRMDVNTTLSSNKIKDYTVYYETYDNQNNWNQQETQISEFFESTDISFSPNVIASGVLTVTPYKTLDISLINKYVGKMYYDNTSSAENQLADYFVANFVAGYTFKAKQIGQIELQLYVNNIFDKEYIANGWVDTYKFTDGSQKVYKGLFVQAPRNIMARVGVKF